MSDRLKQLTRPGSMAPQARPFVAASSSGSAVATPQQPPQPQEGVDRSTDAFTYITRVPGINDPTPILYNGDRPWAKVTLLLETAGPVVVGTKADLAPVLSGKGTLLVTNVPSEFTIAKGSRLYVLATAVNRIGVKIEPLPWLEEIANAAATIARK